MIGPQLRGLKPCMPERLAVGAAGGSATSALLISLAQGFLNNQGPVIPEELFCDCPNFRTPFGNPGWELFIAGLLCGLLLGPFLDICLIVRGRWRRFVLSCLTSLWGGREARQYYRIVHE